MGFFSAIKKFFGQEQETSKKPETPEPDGAAPEGGNDSQILESGASGPGEAARISPLPSDANNSDKTCEAASDIDDNTIIDEQAPLESEIEPAVHKLDQPVQPEQPENAESSHAVASGADEYSQAQPQISPEETALPDARAGKDFPESARSMGAAVQEADSRGAESESIAAGMETAQVADAPGALAATQDESELLLRLRQAEPRLSQWLDIILAGQERADEQFWRRLAFLLKSLEAPEQEIDAFLADFSRWLERMEYEYIDEFRSELQYRLALALDLEDEEDERNRLMAKLGAGLAATRERFGRRLDSLFASHGELDAAFWEEMEELFITADMGYETALAMTRRLKERAAKEGIKKPEEAKSLLVDELEEIFRFAPRIKAANRPEVYLMMGVNGAGKTTTIAKLAHRERMGGKKVLVVAADTFRAAAIEQLQVWAERAGAEFYAKAPGSDPASVAWEGMDYALKNGIDTVFVDTAGRLQTRVNLMEELGKIRQVLARKHPGAPHRSMLVLDAGTGQNALSQARLFREAAGADEIILTKLDGTAKGGVAIAVALKEKMPITYVGLGEKMEDLRPFHGRDFALAIVGGNEKRSEKM